MTEEELMCLQVLLDKAVKCEMLIAHIPARDGKCAEVSAVVDTCINGNSIQLDLED